MVTWSRLYPEAGSNAEFFLVSSHFYFLILTIWNSLFHVKKKSVFKIIMKMPHAILSLNMNCKLFILERRGHLLVGTAGLTGGVEAESKK